MVDWGLYSWWSQVRRLAEVGQIASAAHRSRVAKCAKPQRPIGASQQAAGLSVVFCNRCVQCKLDCGTREVLKNQRPSCGAARLGKKFIKTLVAHAMSDFSVIINSRFWTMCNVANTGGLRIWLTSAKIRICGFRGLAHTLADFMKFV